MENTTTALGILFPFFPAGGDEDCPGCITQTVTPQCPLTCQIQEFCSSRYARKNSNYTIKKKHSLQFTAVIDGMLQDKQNVSLTRSYPVMGKGCYCFTYICCAIPTLIVRQSKQSALNIFFLNKQEKTVSRYQVTVQERPTIAMQSVLFT